MGVSVENEHYLFRIDDLKTTPAKIKFVSFEPLLGLIPKSKLVKALEGIDWVTVGGESGAHARPMKKWWVEIIQRQCERMNIPFFFKQWGGVQKWRTGRKLNGKEYNGFPTHIKREREG